MPVEHRGQAPGPAKTSGGAGAQFAPGLRRQLLPFHDGYSFVSVSGLQEFCRSW